MGQACSGRGRLVGGVRGCRWWHMGPPGPALPLAGIKPSPGPRSPDDGFLWADGRSVKLLLPCKGTLAAQDVGFIRGVSPSHSHHNDSSCRTRLWMIHIWSTIGLRICYVPCSSMSLFNCANCGFTDPSTFGLMFVRNFSSNYIAQLDPPCTLF